MYCRFNRRVHQRVRGSIGGSFEGSVSKVARGSVGGSVRGLTGRFKNPYDFPGIVSTPVSILVLIGPGYSVRLCSIVVVVVQNSLVEVLLGIDFANSRLLLGTA